MTIVVDFGAVQNLAFGTVAHTFTDEMERGTVYEFVATQSTWIKQGGAPVATAGTDGELFVPSGCRVQLASRDGATVSVLRATQDGIATLSAIREV